MKYPTIKLKILHYIRTNTDEKRLVSYSDICSNICDTTDAYIAIALTRLVKENIVFHTGNIRGYEYGITIKGLELLKAYENKQEISKLTLLLKQIARLP